MSARPPRRWVRDLVAMLAGGALFATGFLLWCTIITADKVGTCSGEWRPFLGSGRQAFVTYGCLARDAGPLIGVKKTLRIYDPRWQTVIR